MPRRQIVVRKQGGGGYTAVDLDLAPDALQAQIDHVNARLAQLEAHAGVDPPPPPPPDVEEPPVVVDDELPAPPFGPPEHAPPITPPGKAKGKG